MNDLDQMNLQLAQNIAAALREMKAENERLRSERDHYRTKYFEAQAEIERLMAIIRALFGDWPEPAIEYMDGGDVQDFGVAHRILVPVEVDEPCGDWCACAEYGDFPTTCYRLAAEFRGSET